MELSQLRYALKLAETQSFSKAAEQLYISQPALSQHINSLEKEYGVKLFSRTTRKVELTEIGQEFILSSRKILSDVDELERTLKYKQRLVQGSLIIGLPNTLSHLNLPEKIIEFHKIYPDIHINLKIAWSPELIKLVLNRELDAAITRISLATDEGLDSRLDVRVFMEDSIVVIASKSRALSRLQSVSLNEIAQLPVIAHEKNSSIRQEMDAIFKMNSISPHIICTCPNMDSFLAMIQADFGIGFLSSKIAYANQKDNLVILPLFPQHYAQTAIVTRKTSSDLKALQIFEDYLSECNSKE